MFTNECIDVVHFVYYLYEIFFRFSVFCVTLFDADERCTMSIISIRWLIFYNRFLTCVSSFYMIYITIIAFRRDDNDHRLEFDTKGKLRTKFEEFEIRFV